MAATLDNAGLSNDVTFVNQEGLSSESFLLPLCYASPCSAGSFERHLPIFEKASQVVGGGLLNEMNLLCSPLWKVFSVKAATVLWAFIKRLAEASHPSTLYGLGALPVPGT